MPGAQGSTCSPAGRTTLPDSPGPATPTRPGWCRSSGSGPRQSYMRGPRPTPTRATGSGSRLIPTGPTAATAGPTGPTFLARRRARVDLCDPALRPGAVLLLRRDRPRRRRAPDHGGCDDRAAQGERPVCCYHLQARDAPGKNIAEHPIHHRVVDAVR